MNDSNFLDVVTALCGLVLVLLIALMVWQSLAYRRLYLNDEHVDFDRGHSFPRSFTPRVGSCAVLLHDWEDPWDGEEDDDINEGQPW